jgi:hypothetical protein
VADAADLPLEAGVAEPRLGGVEQALRDVDQVDAAATPGQEFGVVPPADADIGHRRAVRHPPAQAAGGDGELDEELGGHPG